MLWRLLTTSQGWDLILNPLHWQTCILFISVLHVMSYFPEFQPCTRLIWNFLWIIQTSGEMLHISASFVKRECVMITSGLRSSSWDLSTWSRRRRRSPSCCVLRLRSLVSKRWCASEWLLTFSIKNPETSSRPNGNTTCPCVSSLLFLTSANLT